MKGWKNPVSYVQVEDSMHQEHVYDTLGVWEIRLLRLQRATDWEADLQGVLIAARLPEDDILKYSSGLLERYTRRDVPLMVAEDYDALSYFWELGVVITRSSSIRNRVISVDGFPSPPTWMRL